MSTVKRQTCTWLYIFGLSTAVSHACHCTDLECWNLFVCWLIVLVFDSWHMLHVSGHSWIQRQILAGLTAKMLCINSNIFCAYYNWTTRAKMEMGHAIICLLLYCRLSDTLLALFKRIETKLFSDQHKMFITSLSRDCLQISRHQ